MNPYTVLTLSVLLSGNTCLGMYLRCGYLLNFSFSIIFIVYQRQYMPTMMECPSKHIVNLQRAHFAKVISQKTLMPHKNGFFFSIAKCLNVSNIHEWVGTNLLIHKTDTQRVILIAFYVIQ